MSSRSMDTSFITMGVINRTSATMVCMRMLEFAAIASLWSLVSTLLGRVADLVTSATSFGSRHHKVDRLLSVVVEVKTRRSIQVKPRNH